MVIVKFFIAILLASISCYSMSSSDVSNKEILNKVDSYAKMAGMCATYGEMVTFQDRYKIQNGDEFIERFLASETERLQLPSSTNVAKFCLEVVIRDYQVISNSYK